MAWTTPCGTSTEPHRPSPADIRQVAGGVPSPTNLASDALLPCLSASPGLIRALLGSPGTLVRASSRSSTDRASDYGSEGWGFESLRLRPGQRPVPIMERAFVVAVGATLGATGSGSEQSPAHGRRR